MLEKVRFPLADISKKEVFEFAKKNNLFSEKYTESQDFIDPQYFDILFADKPFAEGDIVDLDGKVLGRHKGIEHYTIGQRKGLGVALSYPVYVHSIDAERNRVVLAPIEALRSSSFIIDDSVWAGGVEPQSAFEAHVKIRLAGGLHNAKVEGTKSSQPDNAKSWRITFDEPQTAVTPGQSAVIYDGDVIVGGGVIAKVEN